MLNIETEEHNFKTNSVLIDNQHNVVVFNEGYGGDGDTMLIPLPNVVSISVPKGKGYETTINEHTIKISKEVEPSS